MKQQSVEKRDLATGRRSPVTVAAEKNNPGDCGRASLRLGESARIPAIPDPERPPPLPGPAVESEFGPPKDDDDTGLEEGDGDDPDALGERVFCCCCWREC